jgi:hypothetical protein
MIINGQPQGGFNSARGAKKWAKENIDGITRMNQVDQF